MRASILMRWLRETAGVTILSPCRVIHLAGWGIGPRQRMNEQMLSGKRVVLRTIEQADLPRLWELLEDPEVAVLSEVGPIAPVSLARYEARFEEQTEDPPKDQTWFAIEVDGDVIGQGGLYGIDHFNQRCELGIALGRDYWGKGFGQDAIRTLVRYAFSYLNVNRVSLQVLANDPRAIGAYRKVGFVEEGRLRQQAWIRGHFQDELVMSVLREEWKSVEKP
jgi:RimJ/RimL family protein N-acetyltransferase